MYNRLPINICQLIDKEKKMCTYVHRAYFIYAIMPICEENRICLLPKFEMADLCLLFLFFFGGVTLEILQKQLITLEGVESFYFLLMCSLHKFCLLTLELDLMKIVVTNCNVMSSDNPLFSYMTSSYLIGGDTNMFKRNKLIAVDWIQ